MPTVVEGDFEWDSVKAASNLLKHGVSLAEAATVFADPFAVYLDDGLEKVAWSPSAPRFGNGFSTWSTWSGANGIASSAPARPQQRNAPSTRVEVEHESVGNA